MPKDNPADQGDEIGEEAPQRASGARFYETDVTQSELDTSERRQRKHKEAEETKRLQNDRRARIELLLAAGELIVSVFVGAFIWQQSTLMARQTEIQDAQAEIAANQAKIAAKQTMLAQQATEAEHRPWMFVVRPLKPPLVHSSEHPVLLLNYGVSKLKYWIEIKNYGNGPAIEVAANAWTTEYRRKIAEMPKDDCGATFDWPMEKRTVPPGESLVIPADHVEPSDPALRVRNEYDPDYWMFGRIIYFDMFGRRHMTVFGWQVMGDGFFAQWPGFNCVN